MFVALFAAAILLGPALAHALALPNKLGLDREEYFIVQQIYSGWNRLSVVLSIEFTGVLAACIIYRKDHKAFPFFAAALVILVIGQAIFWLVTLPANISTANWTVVPDDWRELRERWEYSHLANAFCQMTAVAALIIAVLRRSELQIGETCSAAPPGGSR